VEDNCAIDSFNDFQCALPTNASKFSVVTFWNSRIDAHDVYTALAVGGDLQNLSPNTETVQVGKAPFHKSSVGGTITTSAKFNFHGPLVERNSVYNSIDFNRYRELGRRAKSLESGAYKVIVVEANQVPRNSNPCWSAEDFRTDPTEYEDGLTLVIFRERVGNICLSAYSRKFMASVIAPFNRVVVHGEAGFVHGSVVAKEFYTEKSCATGPEPSGLQLHGVMYKGPLSCCP
jgi:hypothetical protein